MYIKRKYEVLLPNLINLPISEHLTILITTDNNTEADLGEGFWGLQSPYNLIFLLFSAKTINNRPFLKILDPLLVSNYSAFCFESNLAYNYRVWFVFLKKI